jgi:hypothetical protein
MTTPRLIGLHGYAQSGKDTLASQLVTHDGFIRRGFADAMRNVLYDMNPCLPGGTRAQEVVDAMGWELAKKTVPGVREYLQDLADAVRHHVGALTWINVVFSNLADNDLVISDLRVPEEYEALRSRNGLFVRITRPGIGPVNGHGTETALDHVDADFTLVNDSTPEVLRECFWAAYAKL